MRDIRETIGSQAKAPARVNVGQALSPANSELASIFSRLLGEPVHL
jgi:hypothetical protein